MHTLHTSDGFEFETRRRGRAIRCVCRRDGRACSVVIHCGRAIDPERVLVEQIEFLAEGVWLSGERVHNCGDTPR